jgi:hypothetical protein
MFAAKSVRRAVAYLERKERGDPSPSWGYKWIGCRFGSSNKGGGCGLDGRVLGVRPQKTGIVEPGPLSPEATPSTSTVDGPCASPPTLSV